ncbi:MAG: fibronectin type III domain-containing protein [Verrucomicrobiae bacterium]|nr:fibronectin type III domain-containing protein [Verrucomicrobiae bacterium]
MNSARKTLCWLAWLLASASVAHSGSLTLAWDPSPTPGVTYRIYAHTTPIGTNLVDTVVKLDAGTNLTASVSNLAPGQWHFVATAVKAGIESEPSNELVTEVPAKPANMRTVTLQWNATVSGTNWLDAGFFRVKFGD